MVALAQLKIKNSERLETKRLLHNLHNSKESYSDGHMMKKKLGATGDRALAAELAQHQRTLL